MERLTSLLGTFAAETGEPLTVVFDGRPSDLSAQSVEVAFATARGPNAADRDIAALVEQDPDPQSITVVTSDRELADRVRAAGARVVGARSFREGLERLAQPDR